MTYYSCAHECHKKGHGNREYQRNIKTGFMINNPMSYRPVHFWKNIENKHAERVRGVEPLSTDWQPAVIPLYDTRSRKNYNTLVPERRIELRSDALQAPALPLSYSGFLDSLGCSPLII